MLIQPVLRPVLQPVLRSIFDPGIGGGGTPIWTPASLFENGEQGALYYFTDDFAGLYQDAAGTIPVTAVEQPVGRILDKSGRGNHATQAAAAARPVLKETGTVRRINFDGVDDKLTTTFPGLGSNATIARSVPGVGASILTGQTIGAGAWDDSTNHCGLVIVNRALTGPETASLTTYLNELAGV